MFVFAPLMLAATAASAAPAEVTILADTNRDGVVDVTGQTDRAGKAAWTNERGAILLPNIGDTARRCPGSSSGLSDAALEACNDAQGDVARAPDYFAPVRTLPVDGASRSAVGRVIAVGAGADKVRVFAKRGTQWVYLGPDGRITQAELRNGAVLGVDARDVVRDSTKWDGRVTLEYSVTDRGQRLADQVAMRVAPVLIHNHLEKALNVLIPESGKSRVHQKFAEDLTGALQQSGYTGPITRMNTTDTWAQDFVEFGYVSMPKAGGGQTTIHIAIRSPQPGRSGGRAVFDLRGPGIGAVQTGGTDYHQADSFGNLETVPPYEKDGVRYPVGRVIYGDVGDGAAPHKDMMRFFESQEVQKPIILDTSWLAIGHVDEFVQFVPADTPRGWKIAIVDVTSALDLLRERQRAGDGGAKAFSRPGASDVTIDQLLTDVRFLRHNELARRKIALNLEILKAETGVTDSEIVKVPGLFEEPDFVGWNKQTMDLLDRKPTPGEMAKPKVPEQPMPAGVNGPREKIIYGQGNLLAFYPGAVNGLIVDRTNYVAPKAWGPLKDGKDILQEAVNAAYASVGITARPIDDWDSHHRIGGEVHCGSNAIRTISKDWWQ